MTMSPDRAFRHIPRRAATVIIRGYQLLISPVIPSSCRFYPTCSSYAMEAFARHGVFKGAWLSLKRIGRCHPWGEPGLDPVPGSGDDAPSHNHNNAGHRSCRHAS